MIGLLLFLAVIIAGALIYLIVYNSQNPDSQFEYSSVVNDLFPIAVPPTVDHAGYDAKVAYLLHSSTTTLALRAAMFAQETPAASSSAATSTVHSWPVTAVYPNQGALLPYNRIVAYYGNFYSKGLGVLGQYPPDQMLAMLQGEVNKWQQADPNTPVIPAIDYIAITAQGQPGDDGKYRARMPADQIEKAIGLANQVHGIVILDLQVGLSDLMSEVIRLEPFLKMPNVELAVDPEFTMEKGGIPGKVIGTVDATDINYIVDYLSQVTLKNSIPPKILVIHRFTENMVTNAMNIKPSPEVQVVMDMDGWGYPAEKIKVFQSVVESEPVQFTGVKLFYKNDLLPPSPGMLTTTQVLNLIPSPSFIQYQ